MLDLHVINDSAQLNMVVSTGHSYSQCYSQISPFWLDSNHLEAWASIAVGGNQADEEEEHFHLNNHRILGLNVRMVPGISHSLG